MLQGRHRRGPCPRRRTGVPCVARMLAWAGRSSGSLGSPVSPPHCCPRGPCKRALRRSYAPVRGASGSRLRRMSPCRFFDRPQAGRCPHAMCATYVCHRARPACPHLAWTRVLSMAGGTSGSYRSWRTAPATGVRIWGTGAAAAPSIGWDGCPTRRRAPDRPAMRLIRRTHMKKSPMPAL